MALYNDTVMEHFMNPRNVDMMMVTLTIDDNEVITDAKFKTFGCGSAIASSSMATELIKGMTVEEALDVSNEKIVEELGGLPAVKIHCSMLAEHAIKNAIYDYAQTHGKEYAGLEGYDPDAEHHDDCEEDEESGCQGCGNGN